jgi:hypothetical protein
VLTLCQTYDVASTIKDDEPRTRGALIYGRKVAHGSTC